MVHICTSLIQKYPADGRGAAPAPATVSFFIRFMNNDFDSVSRMFIETVSKLILRPQSESDIIFDKLSFINRKQMPPTSDPLWGRILNTTHFL